MIAINWFEVLLPSVEFQIPVEHFDAAGPIPEKKKNLDYVTVLRSADGVIYHITDSPPSGTRVETVNFETNPSVIRYAIERGFAAQLERAGFRVRFEHVGGAGYRETEGSVQPHVYQATEGIRFRCFFGFDQGKQKRWGLVLSYATSQYFTISLRDLHLRQFAIGKRAVPSVKTIENAPEDSADEEMFSGILESVTDNEAILVDRHNRRCSVSLDEWTLPCSYHNLIGYIRRTEGTGKVNEVSTKLQRLALTLASDGRMNTALAKDQLLKLQSLMSDNNLLVFHLPIPGLPIARVSQMPLVVEE